jgi:hypothetical protein
VLGRSTPRIRSSKTFTVDTSLTENPGTDGHGRL